MSLHFDRRRADSGIFEKKTGFHSFIIIYYISITWSMFQLWQESKILYASVYPYYCYINTRLNKNINKKC